MHACPQCSEENPPHARFCLACGTRLEAVAQSEERKIVTVLFADVVGFTSMAERLDPEDVRALLTPFYALMRSVLARYGGSIEHFAGDGVMAVFGAPVAHEDDPERAVRAALAIRDAVQERNETAASFQLDIRCGVNTGEVLISHDANGRLVAGDAVNTAQRLQTAAAINGVLVGGATHQATARFIEYRSVGVVEAKGKSEPVHAWEAVAPFSRFGPEVSREAPGPLVARDVEIELLEGMLRRTVEMRESQLVTIIGGPGLGKSRLVTEVFVRGARDGAGLLYWRQGRCPPYGEQAAYSALGDMVRAQAGILDTDGVERAGEKLRRSLERLGGEPDWLERHLRPLVGLPSDRAGERPGEAYAAWRRFFEALARDRPLVMVIEDLHWADDGLLDWIDTLVDRSREFPIYIVCTARPELLERRRKWGGGKRNATTISLAPLPRADCDRLVRTLLGSTEVAPEEVAAVVARADGNPLYAEEFVRMLRDRSTGSIEADSPLPMSVQGIVAARIDALPADEKALLIDAAVVGKLFWPGALAALGAAGDELRTRLRSLERRELIRRQPSSSVAGEDEYAFRNALVREVAYRLLPRSRRAEKHLLAADWIERLAEGREDHAASRAEHYRAALSFARDSSRFALQARRALRDAGDRAFALASPGRAADYYAQALELWPQDDLERPRVLLDLGRALYRHDRSGEAQLAEAREGLLAHGDAEAAAEADVALAMAHFARGRRAESTACLERAADLLRDAPPSRAKVYVLSTLSSFWTLARPAASLAAGAEALAMAEELRDDELRARCLRIVGAGRALRGDPEGVAQLEEAIALARGVDSFEAVPALTNLAATYMSAGDLGRTFELQREASELAERFADAMTVHWLSAERVLEHYWCGRWDAAWELATRLLGEQSGADIDGLVRIVCARIALARGDGERALAESERALETARRARDSQFFLPALATRARVLAETGQGDTARLVDELLLEVRDDDVVVALYGPDLAYVLLALERGDALRELAARVQASSPWLDAVTALGNHDYAAAAATYAEIGSQPDAALAHAHAARAAATAGALETAEEHRAAALAFFASVGAEVYARALEPQDDAAVV
jgi:class 3 adenylate cyclase/tetratricopeptide (TPR) repeat protein